MFRLNVSKRLRCFIKNGLFRKQVLSFLGRLAQGQAQGHVQVQARQHQGPHHPQQPEGHLQEAGSEDQADPDPGSPTHQVLRWWVPLNQFQCLLSY